MNLTKAKIYATVSILILGSLTAAKAQARPALARGLDLSAFTGCSGVKTGLNGASNLSFSAGIDIGFRSLADVAPSIEIRGSYPLRSGDVVDEQSLLAGIKVTRGSRNITLYGLALAGRGELNYQKGGYHVPFNNYIYYQTYSNVLSGGIGLTTRITENTAFRVDIEAQFWDTPVLSSGHIVSWPITAGLEVHVPALRHGRPY